MVRQQQDFIPTDIWTLERAVRAAERMTATYESAEFQELLAQIEREIVSGEPGPPVPPPELRGPPDASKVRFRRAEAADVPVIAQLISSAHLPPLFIEEFLEGFVIADHEGDMIGVGGVELYDDSCFLRSIVVHSEAQGLGLGRRMSELLIEAAKAAGARDVYLFTQDAWPFWLKLGFTDISPEAWKAPAQQTWQYRFVAPRLHIFNGSVHSMWRSADG